LGRLIPYPQPNDNVVIVLKVGNSPALSMEELVHVRAHFLLRLLQGLLVVGNELKSLLLGQSDKGIMLYEHIDAASILYHSVGFSGAE